MVGLRRATANDIGKVLASARLPVSARAPTSRAGPAAHPVVSAARHGGVYEERSLARCAASSRDAALQQDPGAAGGRAVLRPRQDRPVEEVCGHQYGAPRRFDLRAMVMNKTAGQGTYLTWHRTRRRRLEARPRPAGGPYGWRSTRHPGKRLSGGVPAAIAGSLSTNGSRSRPPTSDATPPPPRPAVIRSRCGSRRSAANCSSTLRRSTPAGAAPSLTIATWTAHHQPPPAPASRSSRRGRPAARPALSPTDATAENELLRAESQAMRDTAASRWRRSDRKLGRGRAGAAPGRERHLNDIASTVRRQVS